MIWILQWRTQCRTSDQHFDNYIAVRLSFAESRYKCWVKYDKWANNKMNLSFLHEIPSNWNGMNGIFSYSCFSSIEYCCDSWFENFTLYIQSNMQKEQMLSNFHNVPYLSLSLSFQLYLNFKLNFLNNSFANHSYDSRNLSRQKHFEFRFQMNIHDDCVFHLNHIFFKWTAFAPTFLFTCCLSICFFMFFATTTATKSRTKSFEITPLQWCGPIITFCIKQKLFYENDSNVELYGRWCWTTGTHNISFSQYFYPKRIRQSGCSSDCIDVCICAFDANSPCPKNVKFGKKRSNDRSHCHRQPENYSELWQNSTKHINIIYPNRNEELLIFMIIKFIFAISNNCPVLCIKYVWLLI